PRLARDVLHDGHGAQPDERDRDRVGADAVARRAARGVGSVEEGPRWLGGASASRRRTKVLETTPSRKAWRNPECGRLCFWCASRPARHRPQRRARRWSPAKSRRPASPRLAPTPKHSARTWATRRALPRTTGALGGASALTAISTRSSEVGSFTSRRRPR